MMLIVFSFPPTIMQFRNKRITVGSAFDIHRAENSQQQSMATPPLNMQRAESSRQHVRALNDQFARCSLFPPMFLTPASSMIIGLLHNLKFCFWVKYTSVIYGFWYIVFGFTYLYQLGTSTIEEPP